jgi:hypothetical protein
MGISQVLVRHAAILKSCLKIKFIFKMGIIANLDLLSVGVAIAGIGILGFVVFFNNRQSIINETFLLPVNVDKQMLCMLYNNQLI